MIAYIISVATVGAITAIFCLGVNVTWGWVGQLDLAFYAYVAIGAYAASIFELAPAPPSSIRSYILGLNWPFVPALIGATVAGGLAALIVGGIGLRRLRSDYLTIVTACSALILAAFLAQQPTVVGGDVGVYGVPQPFESILGLGPASYSYFFLGFCLACLLLVYLILEALYRSPFGRSLRAVREDPMAAAAFGRNLYTLRLRAYVISGTVGAFGGAIFVSYLSAWNPASWNIIEVVLLLSGVIVGGRANSRGVILGSIVVESLLPEITRLFPLLSGSVSLGPAVAAILSSVLIIVMLRLRPAGVLAERRLLDRSPALASGPVEAGGGSSGPPGPAGGQTTVEVAGD